MINTLTFSAPMRGTDWDVAWGRVCMRRQKPEEWRNPAELRDLLARYGDRKVERVYPGYGFLIVWLE